MDVSVLPTTANLTLAACRAHDRSTARTTTTYVCAMYKDLSKQQYTYQLLHAWPPRHTLHIHMHMHVACQPVVYIYTYYIYHGKASAGGRASGRARRQPCSCVVRRRAARRCWRRGPACRRRMLTARSRWRRRRRRCSSSGAGRSCARCRAWSWRGTAWG